jgi:Kef-type K+ transport system membrane component KefB
MSASSNLYITIFNVLGLVFIFFIIGLSIDDNKMRERMKVFGFAVVGSIVLNLILYLR